jgi:hypothetical protein
MTDIRKMLEDGRCKPNHGCNVATLCMCAALEDAADEIERLRAKNHELASTIATRLLEKKPCVEIDRLRAALAEEIAVARETDDALAKADAEIERLRAVIVRAKDALLDGQSTQWVHDLLATVLYAQTKE